MTRAGLLVVVDDDEPAAESLPERFADSDHTSLRQFEILGGPDTAVELLSGRGKSGPDAP